MELPNDELLRRLSEQIQEQRRANDLKERELTVLQRKDAVTRSVLERYADLGERVTGLTNSVNELILTLHGGAEADKETAERIERIDQTNQLILGIIIGKRGELTLESLISKEPEIAHLKNLIGQQTRRLRKLKEQEAQLGLEATPRLLTEIEDVETEIEVLQRKLKVIGPGGL